MFNIKTFLIFFYITNFLISETLAGYIFISNEGSDNITVINLETYEIISNIDGGKRPRDMKVIADKLNEGWEIVDFDILYKTGNISRVSMIQQPQGWIVHMKRRVKK